eukprot:5131550-Alexandrium_andersonii.AAC.1
MHYFNAISSKESFLRERLGRPYHCNVNTVARPWFDQVPCESARAPCHRAINMFCWSAPGSATGGPR